MKQQGFTIIELIVALTLGLLISAAAIQLFITSQRSIVSQQGLINLQSSSIFGFDTVIRNIRQANLRAKQPYIDDTTVGGGIVLTGRNLSTYHTVSGTGANEVKTFAFEIDENLLTQGGIGPSNLVGVGSDQLVIQYKVNGPNHFDCEGRSIPAQTYVVQRYFLRRDESNQANAANEPNAPLALACKATRYIESDIDTKDTLTGLDTDGQIIIPRVDHFRVLLGVAKDGMNAACTTAATADATLDCFGYIDINSYKLLAVKPQIVSVQLALLVRSQESIGSNEFFDKDKEYVLLDQQAKLIENANNQRYMRSVLSQTIALRNGFGIES